MLLKTQNNATFGVSSITKIALNKPQLLHGALMDGQKFLMTYAVEKPTISGHGDNYGCHKQL